MNIQITLDSGDVVEKTFDTALSLYETTRALGFCIAALEIDNFTFLERDKDELEQEIKTFYNELFPLPEEEDES